MLDRMLIEHCSPTLGGLKTANLFTYKYKTVGELELQLYEWNRSLNPKGIELSVLKQSENRALVYVCRTSRLVKDLQCKEASELLSQYGYSEVSVSYCIKRLKERLSCGTGFPHEIGLFLGYPIDDVKGFIENVGKNSKCSGCWKVYCNECEAKKLFAKFKKCKEIYTKLFENRIKDVYQLTVAVS